LSTTKNKGIALAVGMFVVLSIVVFGSILYVGFTSVNTEIVVVDTMEDEGTRLGDYLIAKDPNLRIYRGPIEIVPDRRIGIRRGPIEILPEFNPYLVSREPPVLRDPRPVEPNEPVFGSDFTPLAPPVFRNSET